MKTSTGSRPRARRPVTSETNGERCYSDHFPIGLSNMEAKLSLLYPEQFWNESRIHTSRSQIRDWNSRNTSFRNAKIISYFGHSQTTFFCNLKLPTLDIFQCYRVKNSTRTQITVNSRTIIFEPLVSLFYQCFVHILIPKDFLYHFDNFRTIFSSLKQNVIQIRCSYFYVIFRKSKIRQPR